MDIEIPWLRGRGTRTEEIEKSLVIWTLNKFGNWSLKGQSPNYASFQRQTFVPSGVEEKSRIR